MATKVGTPGQSPDPTGTPKKSPGPPPPYPPGTPRSPPPRGAPMTPGGSPQFVMSDAQLLQLLSAMQQSKPVQPTFPAPQIGGVDEIGAWTGLGSECDPAMPRTEDCYRTYYGSDRLKTHTASKSIKDRIKKGLVDHSSNPAKQLFSAPEEPDGDKFVTMFSAMVEFLQQTGLDGLFLIVTSNGDAIDMLESPGMVNSTIIDEWVEDLTSKGVVHQNNPNLRHAVCPQDIANLNLLLIPLR
eukprot:15352168-Ditylum_brightwellii.AAC.1